MSVKELGSIDHKHNNHGALRFSQFFNELRIQSDDGSFQAWIDDDRIGELEDIIYEFKKGVGFQHFPPTKLTKSDSK